MDWISASLRIFVIFVYAKLTIGQELPPAPESLQFTKGEQTRLTVTFKGIANVPKYEVSVHAVYDETDSNGWILSLAGGPTTSTLTLNQLNGFRPNILYKVKVAGVLNEIVGNQSEVVARTAASGLILSPAQILPTIAVLYVTETPGSTLCQIGYKKAGDPAENEQFIQSEEACRVVIIRELDANTQYEVRGRVIAAGGYSYPDNDYGSAFTITTAKLSLFARVDQNVLYNVDLSNPTSATYISRESGVIGTLQGLYQSNGADVSELNVLQFESKDSGSITVVHHEILISSSTVPSLAPYKFTDGSGEFVLVDVTSSVKANAYSLIRTGDNYQLQYNDVANTTSCPSFDARQFVISNSIDEMSRTATLQGFSPQTTLQFSIVGSGLSIGSSNIYFFENNSASAISQKYLLKSCPTGSENQLYSRYLSSKASSTTPGYEDVFVHTTDLFSFPGVRSTGIMQGNGSLITFKRVSNAVKYFITSGGTTATLDETGIDSSTEFEVRISPIEAGEDIGASLQITTKPYDDPKDKTNPISLNTLPSLPTGVTWPYRDQNNLTLQWDKDEGAVGYYILVRSNRDTPLEMIQEYETPDPEAKVGDLKPGRFYLVKVIPYNHAGNASSDRAGFQLHTDKDDPFLFRDAVNVSYNYITIEWTGGKEANLLEIQAIFGTGQGNDTNSTSTVKFDVTVNVTSPYKMEGLQPDTEYNVTIVATYDTGLTQTTYEIFQTDPYITTTMKDTTADETTTPLPEETTTSEIDTTTADVVMTTTAEDDQTTFETTDNNTPTTASDENTTIDESLATTAEPTSNSSTTFTMPNVTSEDDNSTMSNNTSSNINNSTEESVTGTVGLPPAEGLQLEWWHWLLIGLGAILLMAIIAIAVNVAMGGAAAGGAGGGANSTNIMRAIFGAKGMYAVNKGGPPPPVLKSETFRDQD
uniref:uncharacterized protein LOC120334568 n=1 Tax=Styela clava TaxID=7725 RepID=UPI001939A56F|nr:uncharacterized protein LOC120334568 [Styela clava]